MKKIFFVLALCPFALFADTHVDAAGALKRTLAPGGARVDSPTELVRACSATYHVNDAGHLAALPDWRLTDGRVYRAINPLAPGNEMGWVVLLSEGGHRVKRYLVAGTKLPCERFVGETVANQTGKTCELTETDGHLQPRVIEGPAVVSFRYVVPNLLTSASHTITDSEMYPARIVSAPTGTTPPGTTPTTTTARRPAVPAGTTGPNWASLPTGQNVVEWNGVTYDVSGIAMDRWRLVGVGSELQIVPIVAATPPAATAPAPVATTPPAALPTGIPAAATPLPRRTFSAGPVMGGSFVRPAGCRT